jgi:hypothetical protein
LRGQAASAEVVHAHGEVFVESSGMPRQPLASAATLREGDVVSTGPQSSVSLRFVDGSTALLGPQGRLQVLRHTRLAPGGPADTRLQLERGAVESQVVPNKPAPRFELRTPVANLGVRGTDFRGRLAGERLLAEVLEGRVAVGNTALAAGFGTVATAAGVATPRPLPAAPALTELPARVERLPLQFDFAAVGGATQYRAQVFDTDRPGRLVLDSVFDTPRVAWPDDLPDGRYELRLRAAAADAIEGRAAVHAFTLKARPEPPFQLQPRAGEALHEEAVRFAWSRHPEAVRYQLQVTLQADFSMPVVDRNDLTDTAFTASLPPGHYHWRLASVRANGDIGPWGDAVRFTRLPPPPPPPPPPPAPPAQPPQATPAGLVLRWATVALPGVQYQVQVARDAAFTQLVLDETTPASERVLAAPEPGQYHVRVRTVGADGRTGAFGQTQVVDVAGGPRWWWLLPPLLLLLL